MSATSSAATSHRPNLLFVMMDQLQARALRCYGNPVCQTPHLDRIAAGGTLMDRFFVTQALCVPSRCSLFTGRYVHAHRHRGNMSFLREDEEHLGTALRAAGYSTGYAGKNHLLPRGRGERDFDYWRGSANQEEEATWRESAARTDVDPTPPHGTRDDPWPTAFYVGQTKATAAEHADARRTDAALEFLDAVGRRRDRAQPFALVVSYSGPHTPFAAPPGFYGRHRRADVPIPPAPLSAVEGKPPHMAAFRRFYRYDEMRPEDVQEIIGTYYDFVSFLDAEVGRLLAKLDEHGLREDTLIVFTADHGEFAGELGLFEKSAPSFYDCLVHVPFIVSLPGIVPAGARRSDLMEQVDVLPTVLGYLDVAVPEAAHDLRHDPLEHTNLAGRAEYQDVQRELEGRIFAWLVRSEDPRT